MDRIRLGEVYALGQIVHPLTTLSPGVSLQAAWPVIDNARNLLAVLLLRSPAAKVKSTDKLKEAFDESIHRMAAASSLLDLPRSNKVAMDLMREIMGLVTEHRGKAIEEEASADAVVRLVQQATYYQRVLVDELNDARSFVIAPLGIYDPQRLMENAEEAIIDPVLRVMLSADSTADLRHAGQCISFDQPTAAAFHIHRALESVMRDYYTKVIGSLPTKRERNWGALIKSLGDGGAPEQITGYLNHIKNLHRNPVVHPEVRLTQGEAVEVFSLAVSVMQAMLRELAP